MKTVSLLSALMSRIERYTIIQRLSLRKKIYLTISILVLIVTTSDLIIIRYTIQMETILSTVVKKNLINYQLAESLETALINQKGFVTYYYLDKDPNWLVQLDKYRQIFRENLYRLSALTEEVEQKEAVLRFHKEYIEYSSLKDQVIEYYKEGKTVEGAKLNKANRDRFVKIVTACETFKSSYSNKINTAWKVSQKHARMLIISVVMASIIIYIIILVLVVGLATRILDPLRSLVLQSDKGRKPEETGDEVKTLSKNVRGLIKYAGETEAELEQSREFLIQSEKLALVGKLAANMAHSIRNPLTSVKMRIFSLGRILEMTDSQKEDFDVIYKEIKHLDTIVQNFLEFSRPPKLIMRQVSPSTVVDQSLQLLKHRLVSYNVTVEVIRDRKLPEILGDSEQLKEVLVNLIINACESMEGRGGKIWIQETRSTEESSEKRLLLQIRDNGPGISPGLMERVFQPFFSTKDEGTGLGLSIAAKIIDEHQGTLEVESEEGIGTTFILSFSYEGA